MLKYLALIYNSKNELLDSPAKLIIGQIMRTNIYL